MIYILLMKELTLTLCSMTLLMTSFSVSILLFFPLLAVVLFWLFAVPVAFAPPSAVAVALPLLLSGEFVLEPDSFLCEGRMSNSRRVEWLPSWSSSESESESLSFLSWFCRATSASQLRGEFLSSPLARVEPLSLELLLPVPPSFLIFFSCCKEENRY